MHLERCDDISILQRHHHRLFLLKRHEMNQFKYRIPVIMPENLRPKCTWFRKQSQTIPPRRLYLRPINLPFSAIHTVTGLLHGYFIVNYHYQALDGLPRSLLPSAFTPPILEAFAAEELRCQRQRNLEYLAHSSTQHITSSTCSTSSIRADSRDRRVDCKRGKEPRDGRGITFRY